MTINKALDNGIMTVKVEGRLDTVTAPDLEKELADALDGVKTLVMDFADLSYISSAGLRVILQLQKTMNKQGNMVVKNVNESTMEVFEVTGFVDILTIE